MVVNLEKFLDGMVNFWHADGTDLLAQSADFLFQVSGCGLRVFGTRIGKILVIFKILNELSQTKLYTLILSFLYDLYVSFLARG